VCATNLSADVPGADVPAGGVSVDGVAVDGVAVDGVAVDGVAVDGVAVDGVAVDTVMADVQARVRERLRERILRQGGSTAFQDADVFADVERLMLSATESGDASALLLPELLGEPRTWRVETAMRYQSHRSSNAGSVILFAKRRILMPIFRWLFEYSRDNFERQRRVNQVLFACVQELAIETALLRRELRQSRGRAAGDAD
jgi:hypothetical protein